jgi:hypothetical protein
MKHVIQLFDGMAIIVDDVEFNRVLKRFRRWSLSSLLEITDVRGHKMTVRKKHILLFEESHEQDETKS